DPMETGRSTRKEASAAGSGWPAPNTPRLDRGLEAVGTISIFSKTKFADEPTAEERAKVVDDVNAAEKRLAEVDTEISAKRAEIEKLKAGADEAFSKRLGVEEFEKRTSAVETAEKDL